MKIDEVVFALKILRENNGKSEWRFFKKKDMDFPELGTLDFEEARQFSCRYSIEEFLATLDTRYIEWAGWKAVEIVEVSLHSHKIIHFPLSKDNERP